MNKVEYNKTGTILDAICEKKLEEIEAIKAGPYAEWKKACQGIYWPANRFKLALIKKTPGIIAEIKKGSPSEGTIREEINPFHIAWDYRKYGASAISVVTDKQFFKGDIAWIKEIKGCGITTPVLRKDFILDECQVYETKMTGADAVLLIAAILDENRLKELHQLVYKLGMEALVEVHTREELQVALRIGAEIIGINNRNLKGFNVDHSTFASLAKDIPHDKIVVAESGIHSQKDFLFMKEQGADAVLIGTHFMRAHEPGKALADLISVLK